MPGTTPDVIIWDKYGPSTKLGLFKNFEVGNHDGAYNGRLHWHTPFIGRKVLTNVKESITMYMAIIVFVLSTHLPVCGIGRSFETFGWVLLVTYMPIHPFFCILHNFRSVGRCCISRTDFGSISLLQFGTTRKHLHWSLTWMIPICANCVHIRTFQECSQHHLFLCNKCMAMTHVICQMINHNYIVLLFYSNQGVP